MDFDIKERLKSLHAKLAAKLGHDDPEVKEAATLAEAAAQPKPEPQGGA